jgi:hypothetical protein
MKWYKSSCVSQLRAEIYWSFEKPVTTARQTETSSPSEMSVNFHPPTREGMYVRAGTHYLHVTWAHVMLRVQLGCERRFNIEFYDADSHFCHSAYVTWSNVELWSAHAPARLSHFCCRTHFVRRDERVECSALDTFVTSVVTCVRIPHMWFFVTPKYISTVVI